MLSLAGVLVLQGKYNDKENEEREHCATRRERPSLNLHFQHFARRQITTSLRCSSDINDIFDLRRRRHRRRPSPSRSSSSSLCPPPSVFRNSTMDAGYLRTRPFHPLNEERTSIIGDQFASKTDVAHIHSRRLIRLPLVDVLAIISTFITDSGRF